MREYGALKSEIGLVQKEIETNTENLIETDLVNGSKLLLFPTKHKRIL